jgi:hypothetical protein
VRPYLEKPFTKKGWWSGSKYRPWVQAPVPKKKKKKRYFLVSTPISCIAVGNISFFSFPPHFYPVILSFFPNKFY